MIRYSRADLPDDRTDIPKNFALHLDLITFDQCCLVAWLESLLARCCHKIWPLLWVEKFKLAYLGKCSCLAFYWIFQKIWVFAIGAVGDITSEKRLFITNKCVQMPSTCLCHLSTSLVCHHCNTVSSVYGLVDDTTLSSKMCCEKNNLELDFAFDGPWRFHFMFGREALVTGRPKIICSTYDLCDAAFFSLWYSTSKHALHACSEVESTVCEPFRDANLFQQCISSAKNAARKIIISSCTPAMPLS